MKNTPAMAIAALAVLAFSACSGGGKAASTPTRMPPVTTATVATFATSLAKTAPAIPSVAPPPAATATPGAASATKLEVIGGVPGGAAKATIHTAPGTTCSIVYRHPAGKISTARGLTSKIAGADGVASWVWAIDRTTKPGNGTVTVTCGTERASAPISIGPLAN